MNFLNFVDGCYYINLPHRVDKNDAILKHFGDVSVSQCFKRSDGVLPASLGFTAKDDGKFEHIQYSIAAAQAHVNVVKHAKKNNFKSIMVLEDDARFYMEDGYSAVETVYKALQQLSKISDWEVLYLGGDLGEPALNLIDDNLLKVSNVASSHAYVLNCNTFNHIINTEKSITHFDSYICLQFTKKYMCYPLGIYQQLLNKTDIMETTYTPDLSFWKKAYTKPINKLY